MKFDHFTKAHTASAAIIGLIITGVTGTTVVLAERDRLKTQISANAVQLAALSRATAFQTYRELHALYLSDGKLSGADAVRICIALDALKNFRPAWTRAYCR